MPLGWEDLGYRPIALDGERNFFNVVGNATGLRDAGRAFYLIYVAWLEQAGFHQSTVERCLFYRRSAAG